MAMDKVNGSPAMRPGLIDQFQRTKPGQEAPDPGVIATDSPLAGKPAAPGDKAEISQAAHRMAELREAVDIGRTALKALPEVRQDRIDEVKDRLDKGYYQSVEVIETVAERLSPVIDAMDGL